MNLARPYGRNAIVALRTAVRRYGLAAVTRSALRTLRTGGIRSAVEKLGIDNGRARLSFVSPSIGKRAEGGSAARAELLPRSSKVGRAELLYYLHIPKTAGTSVIRFLDDVYDPAIICPYGLWDELVRASSDELAVWRVYIGHFAGVLPLWLRRWPRTLTILRDPVARTISHIRHVRRDAGHPLHQLAVGKRVSEYCVHPVLRRSVENLQSRYLASLTWGKALTHPAPGAGREHGQLSIDVEAGLYALDRGPLLQRHALDALESLDAVGIAEEHVPTLDLFARILNVPRPHSEYRFNVAPERESTDLGLTGEDLAAVESITEIDKIVYEFGCQLFRKQIAEYGLSSKAGSSHGR